MTTPLDVLCASRTKAKTKVTRSVTRLSDSIPLGLTPETIYKLYVNTEELYNSYMDVSDDYKELCHDEQAVEKYITVNKMNLEQYDWVACMLEQPVLYMILEDMKLRYF